LVGGVMMVLYGVMFTNFPNIVSDSLVDT